MHTLCIPTSDTRHSQSNTCMHIHVHIHLCIYRYAKTEYAHKTHRPHKTAILYSSVSGIRMCATCTSWCGVHMCASARVCVHTYVHARVCVCWCVSREKRPQIKIWTQFRSFEPEMFQKRSLSFPTHISKNLSVATISIPTLFVSV